MFNIFSSILIIAGLILLTFFLSIMIKNKKILLVVEALLIFGLIFVVYQMQFTSFKALYSEEIFTNNTVVEEVRITEYKPAKDQGLSEIDRQMTIKDTQVIEDILNDFSQVELKKDRDSATLFKQFGVRFLTTKKVKEDYHLSDYQGFRVNKNYLGTYEIINETNHLKTILSIMEKTK
ncbi:hypothetical protein GWK91_02230 [Virgibacillus sp. MSP4-1]|uniref:hypothetical protein n=1 Tax=Virgibacillus sp. MSP4-1 TaxID=2700081 RepID=UPI0003A9D7A8|nr:hypothetical protein [Virgibacillus sp. MSP4-1]QHS21833.1 hypothetical protein GWK91_02230 [Virgibacillus sp. MSP4-1]